MQFSFRLDGPPQSKQRARITGRGCFTPLATRRREREMQHAAKLARNELPVVWPIDGQYELDCVFYMDTYRLVDCDNLLKLAADALQNGVAYENDNQVTKMSGLRIYGDPEPRTEVTVTYLGEKPKRAKRSKKK